LVFFQKNSTSDLKTLFHLISKMQTILIDHREHPKIKKELIKHELDIKEKQLGIADYIIRTKDFNGKILRVGIEKKTKQDFLNSIIDKRLIKQLIELKENFDIPLLILEGSENIYSIRNFHPNSIRGMLASIAIDFQVPILQTRNFRDTASLIAIIAKRLEKSRYHPSLLKKPKPLTLKQQQEFLIETLPGIGPTLSKSLLKKFKTIKKIINTHPKRLQKIKKIGPKKAEKLHKLINEKYKD